MNNTLNVSSTVPIKTTQISLTVADDATQDQLKAEFHKLTQSSESNAFWLGDLLLAIEARHGQKYALALAKTKFSYNKLKEFKSVCNRIPPASRNPAVSYTHHCDAINLTGDLDLAVKYIDLVERERLPVSQMRKLIKTDLNPRKDEEKVTIFVSKWKIIEDCLNTIEYNLPKVETERLDIQKDWFRSRINTLLELANNL
ncbi:MAG: hypothetical protein V4501_00860 [Pseudomonadota bacterium]